MRNIENWTDLCEKLGELFGIDVDLNGVLFLVGIRERGLLFQKFSKEEKLNLINLGSCILYQEMGLITLCGKDEDGWPVFHQNALAPLIPEELKLKTLQNCAIRYFKKVFDENSGKENQNHF
jgi:hypothetical protein